MNKFRSSSHDNIWPGCIRINKLCQLMLNVLLLLFVLTCGIAQAQTDCRQFSSAQEAIDWANANKLDAAGVKQIVITGNNDESDLLKLRMLNNNSGTGLFKTLEDIELSGQKGTVPGGCFYVYYTGAQWLKRFSAPYITHVGSWAFRDCTTLSEVNLPTVKSIGAYAFYSSNLSTILLPESLDSIASNPFLGCKNLRTITVDNENTHFKVENGVLYDSTKTLLIAYPLGRSGSSFICPASTKTVANNAFGVCSGLSAVELPGVSDIRDWAMEYCTGLKTVRFGTADTMTLSTDAFSNISTSGVDLYLNSNGMEFYNVVNGNTWKAYEWKSINNENTSLRKEPDKSGIKLYPNPVYDCLHIDSKEQISHVAIYNLNSDIVVSINHMNPNEINMSSLPTGVYIVRIETPSEVKKQLILKIN